jgi:hypothetical protein
MMLLAALVLTAAPQEELKAGLVGEYVYVGKKLDAMPKPDREVGPRFKRVDQQVDFLRTFEQFGGTKLKDRFCVVWTGLVRIPKDGRWVFFTVSDDGSRLFIDGKLVVDNDGRHEMREEDGDVQLKAGDHEIRVEYYDDFGHAGMRILWEGPGTAKDVIPASALFHRKSQAPTERERKGIEIEPPPFREGDEAQARKPEREGERPREGDRPRDGERPREGDRPRDGEKPREGDRPRDGERPREGDRPREAPRAEQPSPKPDLVGPLDERVVTKGEAPPDVGGRILSAFEDGPSAMLVLKTRQGELPIFLEPDTKKAYVGLAREEQRPAPLLQVYVWLKPGSTDRAREVRIFKDAPRR